MFTFIISMKKIYTQGTHRICAPSDTLSKIYPCISEMGITRIADITGLDYIGIPVFLAIRPNSFSMSLSQGKGITEDAAKVSALMEAVETYHAEHIALDTLNSSYEELSETEDVICVYDLPMYRDALFDPTSSISWIKASSIVSGKDCYVPYEVVHTKYSVENEYLQSGALVSSSNGLASGNSILEASLHGIYELIERDAYSCWSLQNMEIRSRTKVILETVEDDDVKALIKKFENAGIKIGIWDITSDIGIPSFLVRIISKDAPPLNLVRPAIGMGCHLNKNIALSRALTEAAQSRLTFIAGARDDLQQEEYEIFTKNKIEYDKWKMVIEAESYVDFRELKNVDNESLSKDIEFVKRALYEVGVRDILVVDLQKQEYSINVVRVIIPGLEGSLSYKSMKLGKRAYYCLETQDREGQVS